MGKTDFEFCLESFFGELEHVTGLNAVKSELKWAPAHFNLDQQGLNLERTIKGGHNV